MKLCYLKWILGNFQNKENWKNLKRKRKSAKEKLKTLKFYWMDWSVWKERAFRLGVLNETLTFLFINFLLRSKLLYKNMSLMYLIFMSMARGISYSCSRYLFYNHDYLRQQKTKPQHVLITPLLLNPECLHMEFNWFQYFIIQKLKIKSSEIKERQKNRKMEGP